MEPAPPGTPEDAKTGLDAAWRDAATGTWRYHWAPGNQIEDGLGVEGQGTPNPPSLFARHFIVFVNLAGKVWLYDPSYASTTEPVDGRTTADIYSGTALYGKWSTAGNQLTIQSN